MAEDQGMTTDMCGAMGCRHPRASHTTWGACTEKRAFHNEHLYGYAQPVIYKTCGCAWAEPVTLTPRPITDNPQA